MAIEISVRFDGSQWTTSPNPAKIKAGELVSWKFQGVGLKTKKIRWMAYFVGKSPFGTQGRVFATTTLLSADGHVGQTGTMSADEPGDYKYGVRAEDGSNESQLGDDDPRLIVVAENLRAG